MRRLILLFTLLAACGDNSHAVTGDGGLDASPPDAPSGHLTGCLDRTGVLPTAPSGQLTCDLVPPGVSL